MSARVLEFEFAGNCRRTGLLVTRFERVAGAAEDAELSAARARARASKHIAGARLLGWRAVAARPEDEPGAERRGRKSRAPRI